MLERPLAARSTGDAVRVVAPHGVSWTSMAFHGVSRCFYIRAASGCFRISDDLMLKPKDTAAPSLLLFGSSQRSFAE